jgi:transposase
MIREKGAGADIHKDSFNAAIVSLRERRVIAETKLPNNIQGAQRLALFLHKHDCPEIAMESTGPYWMSIYDYLAQHGIKVLLANPANLKAIVGKKTDRIDAMVLAYLHLAGLVTPSYIPDKAYRRLRNLTRTREKIVAMKTAVKNATTNQIHTFSSEITSVFADTFSKSGMKMLRTLLQHIEQLEHIKNQAQATGEDEDEGEGGGGGKVDVSPLLQKLQEAGLKESKIQKVGIALQKAYTPCIDAGMASFFLEMVGFLDQSVKEIDDQLARLICEDHRIGRQVALLVSIPGVSLVTGASMAAEICDVSRFPSDKKMAGYMGLVPSVYQSGSKRITGRITKRGSPHARRAYYQAAMAIVRTGRNGSPELVEFYNRVKSRKGHKVAAVALARKLAAITYHMLTRQQNYEAYLEWDKERREEKKEKREKKIGRIRSQARRARERKTSLAQILEIAKKMEVLEVMPQELRAACA